VAVVKNLKFASLPMYLAISIAAIYVLLPLLSAGEFSLRQPVTHDYGLQHYIWFIELPDFAHYLLLSLGLALGAAALVLLLLVPTAIWLNLGGQKLRGFIEFLTLLPLVIPVVALAIGAQSSLPEFAQTNEIVLSFMYAVLALPYAYRTLDTGLKAVPLKTITEAARGLGAGWTRTILQVVTPVVRSTVLSALFITLALSLGEFTLTSLLHWDTFTTWVTTMSQSNILGAIALSVFSLVAVFVLLMIIGLFVKPASNQISTEEK
jgi:putative spermidine/putrescine transport system permease protein